MSATAKSLSNVSRYVARWKERMSKRFSRIYDDRDQALADALKLVEERSDSYYAAILTIVDDLTVISAAGGALTGLAMSGTNLIGDADKASGSSSDSTGELSFAAVLPGEQTITITIDLEGDGTGSVTADADAGTITLSSDGTVTASEFVTLMDADAEAKFMVAATAETDDAMDAAETVSVTNTSGVADPGTMPSMTLGSQSFNGADAGFGFTSWSDTAIAFDMDPSALDVGTTYFLRLWVDDVLVLTTPVTIVT